MPTSTNFAYITTATGSLTTPPGSPKILIHTRQGRVVGIYCDQPAKIIEVETQENPKRITAPSNVAFRSSSAPRQA
jgi:hypothetical protein